MAGAVYSNCAAFSSTVILETRSSTLFSNESPVSRKEYCCALTETAISAAIRRDAFLFILLTKQIRFKDITYWIIDASEHNQTFGLN